MRRKSARPYGQSITGIRLVSAMMALLVLWMLYSRLKDPSTWRGIADDHEVRAATTVSEVTLPETENLVPGPNDQDEEEAATVHEMFEVVNDRAPLKPREMGVYWRLMDWSRTQPFSELKKRGRDDIPFTQLWEQPELYRGKLLRLKLHVRRVLHYDAPENPNGIVKVYEAWGYTDESLSFPYVFVFPDRPEGLPIGQEMRANVIFVGYFMKIMTYTAFDNPRGAPLLVGRVQLVSTPKAAPPSKFDPWVIPLIVLGGTIFMGFSIWTGMRSRNASKVKMLPKSLAVGDSSSGATDANPFGLFDPNLPSSDLRVPPGTFDFAAETETPPSPDVKAESAVDLKKESIAENVTPESISEVKVEPIAVDVNSEPVANVKTEPIAADVKTGTNEGTKSESVTDAKKESMTADAETEPVHDAKPKPVAAITTEPIANVKADSIASPN